MSRALGCAVANGSVRSISILSSRPERRSPTGTDRIWVSSSAALGAAGTSRSTPTRLADVSQGSCMGAPVAVDAIVCLGSATVIVLACVYGQVTAFGHNVHYGR